MTHRYMMLMGDTLLATAVVLGTFPCKLGPIANEHVRIDARRALPFGISERGSRNTEAETAEDEWNFGYLACGFG